MNYLIHHGIKGQQWGIQNGPPYPLNTKTHRKVINKAKETVQKVKEDADNYRKSFNKQKAIKMGAIAAGAALAAVGGYYLYKSGTLDSLVKYGKNFVRDVQLNDAIPNEKPFGATDFSQRKGSLTSQLKGKTFDRSKIGKSYDDIDKGMVESINKELRDNGTMGGNCPSATAAYLLNTFYGTDFKTVPMKGIDKEGAKILEEIFKLDSMNEIDPAKGSDAFPGVRMGERVFKMIPNGSTGFLHTYSVKYGDHAVVYEKTKEGVLTLCENKLGKTLTGDILNYQLGQYGFCKRIVDCSHVELVDGLSEETLRKFVS